MIGKILRTPMTRHFLHSIDLETQTAFCSVCGFTKIYVSKTRTRHLSRVMCIRRANELREANLETHEHLREKRQSKSNWKPRHSISEVDPETLIGICSMCGPVDIRKSVGKKYTNYHCANHVREWMREYKRLHYVARPTNPHALSQIDEEKQSAVCATCGPVKIEIYYGTKKLNRRCINARSQSIS
jgi:hypothetical protein